MTDTPTPRRSFKKGADAAKAAASSSGFSRAGFFKLEDGDRAFVQFITDCEEWITVDTHPMVPTKAKPSDYQGDKWPAKIQPVCRLTTMGDGLPLHTDCYVCENIPGEDNKPFKKSARTYALGVILEEVIGDGSDKRGGENKKGKRVGFKMKVVDYTDPETKTVTKVPDVQVFTFGWGNFYAALEGAAQVNDGTICNLAFAIQRNGKGLDTKYAITSMGVQPRDFNDEVHLAKVGITKDQSGEKVYPTRLDLYEMVEDKASDDYYARFIDPTKKAPSQGDSRGASAPKAAEAEPADLEAMRARLLGYSEAESNEAAPAASSDSSSDADYDED